MAASSSSSPFFPRTWKVGDKEYSTGGGKTTHCEMPIRYEQGFVKQGTGTIREGPQVNEYSPWSDDLIGPLPVEAVVAAKRTTAGGPRPPYVKDMRKFSAERIAIEKKKVTGEASGQLER